MALTIKNAKTDQLARSIVEVTGESLTEAVSRALEDRLQRLQRERALDSGKERALSYLQICHQHRQGDFLTDDDLYDESGAPR